MTEKQYRNFLLGLVGVYVGYTMWAVWNQHKSSVEFRAYMRMQTELIEEVKTQAVEADIARRLEG